ncbi:DUF397 domain-containing protein [Streptomyces sp. TRM66268-LWL]|uniref:DUF397 domain-containing protein n=1 Tax=Streptomyces polyasparticus TaxID=2767826 RepID=A0ABR7SRZ9_9ACTN|nr:DUF397 domain-containing protein [Streptomyces polyasparticus]MBC9717103.1 DUF397 domain-containing protein [Streptomyces polyasparticus]
MNTELEWFKSSYSGTEGGDCLEVALTADATHIRDSKLGPRSPQFVVAADTWGDFVAFAQSAIPYPES